MDRERWDGEFNRLPGGPTWPAVTIVATRRREVEIHHADLGAAYTHHDWPDDFAAELLDTVCVDQAASGPFRVRATDLGREWQVGEGDPDRHGDGQRRGARAGGSPVAATATASPPTRTTLPALGPWQRAHARAVR